MKRHLGLAVILIGCHHRNDPTRQEVATCNTAPRVVRPTVVSATPDSGVIEGTVYDAASLKPLREAVILITGSQIGARTDVNGNFRLPRLANGADTTVILRILALGYQPQRDTLARDSARGARLQVYVTAGQVCLQEVRTGL